MNIHCLVFLLSILLRDAENAAKSALAQNPEEEIEAARAHLRETDGRRTDHSFLLAIAAAAAWYCMVPVPVPWLSLFKQICRYRKYNHEVFSFIVHHLAVLAIHRAA